MQSGKYMPAASWVIPCQGSGMDLRRATSFWKMMITPEETTAEDVHRVFFKTPQRYWEENAAEYVHTIHVYEDEVPRREQLIGPRPKKPGHRCVIDNPNCNCAPPSPPPPVQPAAVMGNPLTTTTYQRADSALSDDEPELLEVTEQRVPSAAHCTTVGFMPFDM